MMPYIHFQMHDTLSKTCGGGVGRGRWGGGEFTIGVYGMNN